MIPHTVLMLGNPKSGTDQDEQCGKMIPSTRNLDSEFLGAQKVDLFLLNSRDYRSYIEIL